MHADGSVDNSTSSAALHAGGYSYTASYGGNTDYTGGDSGCEKFIVDQASTTTTSSVFDETSSATVDNTNHASLGDKTHDTSSVTTGNPSGFSLAGSVTYTFYANNTCSGSPSGDPQTVHADGSVDNSTSSAALHAGGYSYTASYGGNTDYTGGDSGCEKFIVDQASTTTTSSVFDETSSATVDNTNHASLGDKTHDTSSVTTGNPSGFSLAGSVTYTFYANNTCSGSPSGDPQTVHADGSVDNSTSSAALHAGGYSYTASYGGNTDYTGGDSGCEKFIVDQASTTTTSSVFDETSSATVDNTNHASLGDKTHDTSSVTTGNPSGFSLAGSVTYTFYANNTCSGSPSGDPQTVHADGSVDNSTSSAALHAGGYSYTASYGGNTDYTGGDSGCEKFIVDQAASSTSTIVNDHANNVVDADSNKAALGTKLHDTATVTSGNNAFVISGTVSYQRYSGLTCQTGNELGSADVQTMSGGTVPNSTETAGLSAGDYSYQATYNGDSNYAGSTGACEPFTVDQAATTTSSTVKDGTKTVDNTIHASLGDRTHDTSSVSSSNGSFSLAGTVTYYLYPTNDCSGPATTSDSGNVNATGTADDSLLSNALAAGGYSYKAVYSGNTNYIGSTGACEPFTVDKASTSTGSTVKDGSAIVDNTNHAALGDQVHDTSSVSSSNNSFGWAGTVTYYLYTNNYCTAPASTSETVSASSGGVVNDSSLSSALAAGGYSYKAVYSGNSNYIGSTGACEPFRVDKANTSTASEIDDGSGTAVTSAGYGVPVHDKATVSGSVSGFSLSDGGGTVSFTFFTSSDCSTGSSAAGSVAPDSSGVSAPSTTETPNVGSHSFKAHYGGNSNYNVSDSGCEHLTVNKANTSTTATQSTASVTYGSSDTVSFSVSSAAGVTGQNATGNVSVTKTAGPSGGNLNCQDTEASPTSSPAVNASETTGSGFTFNANSGSNSNLRLVCTPDKVGTYNFHLNFGDSDGNYNGSYSSPDLILTVGKANTSTTAAQSAASITYGSSDTVSFSVSSAAGVTGQNATGNVSVTKTAGPSGGNLNCQDTEASPTSSPAVNASETTGSGFTFNANSGSNSNLRLVCTPDKVGTYNFHLNFGDSDGNYNGSYSSPDLILTVGKANTSTTATQSATSIAFGSSDTLSFTVSSAAGVSGQTATGTASVVKDSGPGNLNCQDTETTPTSTPGVSASETNTGFSLSSTSTNHLQLVCTPDAVGAYTFHVHFSDSDGNYNGSDSSTSPSLGLTVSKALTLTSVSVSPASQQYSDQVTITATISPASVLGYAPATNVSFKIGTTTVAGPVNLTSNGSGGLTATATVSLKDAGYPPSGDFSPGSHTVTAVFGGIDTTHFTVRPDHLSDGDAGRRPVYLHRRLARVYKR